MSVKETVTLLTDLREYMKGEPVGDDETFVAEWTSIRGAIAKLCQELPDAKSVEEWTATIKTIEVIRDRVSKMPTSTSHWIKWHVNEVLNKCVQMIERHCPLATQPSIFIPPAGSAKCWRFINRVRKHPKTKQDTTTARHTQTLPP